MDRAVVCTKESNMHVYSALVELRLPSRSLKGKRGIVKSILARSRQRFNLAAAEVEQADNPEAAILGFTTVSGNRRLARQQLEQLEQWLAEERPDVEIIAVDIEER
jgi:uncharacterized protein YlxP (DUF503 family)